MLGSSNASKSKSRKDGFVIKCLCYGPVNSYGYCHMKH